MNQTSKTPLCGASSSSQLTSGQITLNSAAGSNQYTYTYSQTLNSLQQSVASVSTTFLNQAWAHSASSSATQFHSASKRQKIEAPASISVLKVEATTSGARWSWPLWLLIDQTLSWEVRAMMQVLVRREWSLIGLKTNGKIAPDYKWSPFWQDLQEDPTLEPSDTSSLDTPSPTTSLTSLWSSRQIQESPVWPWTWSF